jgi:hypothetical protein
MQPQKLPPHQQRQQQQQQQQQLLLSQQQQQMLQGASPVALPDANQLGLLEQLLGFNSSACSTPAATQPSMLVLDQQQQQQQHMHVQPVVQASQGYAQSVHAPVESASPTEQQQQPMLPHMQQQQQQASPACGAEGNCSSSICSTSGYGTASKQLPVLSPDCTEQQQPADSSDNIMAALLATSTDW